MRPPSGLRDHEYAGPELGLECGQRCHSLWLGRVVTEPNLVEAGLLNDHREMALPPEPGRQCVRHGLSLHRGNLYSKPSPGRAGAPEVAAARGAEAAPG